MRYRISHTQSCSFISFQNTRKSCFNFVGSTPTFLFDFARHSGSHWCSNFSRAFLMVSLNSLSSESTKYIPRNLRALSRWSFTYDHFCFSFSFAFFPILFPDFWPQMIWPGCQLFSRQSLPDHVYPSGGFSSNFKFFEWRLSTDQTILLTHRYSNNHRCVSLAWHPNSYE